MTRRTLTVLTSALSVLALGGGLAYGTTKFMSSSGQMSGMAASSTGMTGMTGMQATSTGMNMGGGMLPTGPNFDRTFIDNMVPHHQGAVAMARIELAKGKRASLQTLARGIISAQNSEITLMKSWRLRWYGSATTPMKMGMSMPGMDTASVANASDVDHSFLTQMVTHHRSAITMATQALKDAKHAEVRALAGRIIKAQQREISVMQRWRKSWYG
jgi:uncharacterized protein (DUF305 family)